MAQVRQKRKDPDFGRPCFDHFQCACSTPYFGYKAQLIPREKKPFPVSSSTMVTAKLLAGDATVDSPQVLHAFEYLSFEDRVKLAQQLEFAYAGPRTEYREPALFRPVQIKQERAAIAQLGGEAGKQIRGAIEIAGQ